MKKKTQARPNAGKTIATTATVHDPERLKFWLESLDTDTVPILSIIPALVSTPSHSAVPAYMLDVNALTAEQQESLIAAMAKRFNMRLVEARRYFFEEGVPVLANGVTVTSNNPGLLFSVVDDSDDYGDYSDYYHYADYDDYDSHDDMWGDDDDE